MTFEEQMELDSGRVQRHIAKAGEAEDYHVQRTLELMLRDGMIARIKRCMRHLHPEEIPRLALSEHTLIADYAKKLLQHPEWHLITPDEEYE